VGTAELSLNASLPLKCNGKRGKLCKAALVNKGVLGKGAEDNYEGNGEKTPGHQHVL